ncbi:DUF397 domain-containing protein [Streptomyces thermolineatus]|uniref:DUF397 domain-containing protein n=1 Tax=Streptomyces thermolineatus TaxID=44033 RepID=A0ABN3LWQ5_9ACTN
MTDKRAVAGLGNEWRKSSHSGGEGDCVEVALLSEASTGVRDSKDRGGPVLTFSDEAWAGFVAGVRAGEFDPR